MNPYQRDERSNTLAEKLRQADEDIRRLTAERNALRDQLRAQFRELDRRLSNLR